MISRRAALRTLTAASSGAFVPRWSAAGTTPTLDSVRLRSTVEALSVYAHGWPSRGVAERPNVIPGEVTLSIELSDLSPATAQNLADAICGRAALIARETRTEIDLGLSSRIRQRAPTPLCRTPSRASADAGLTSVRLPSGAGHDAQMMARLRPMGMIFVPSIDGISHSPHQRTTWEDCVGGAQVLVNTILAMDLEV
jgi:acetylornithine deacetylase/succinyl-diaminopimelate desuccinylase-like protein